MTWWTFVIIKRPDQWMNYVCKLAEIVDEKNSKSSNEDTYIRTLVLEIN